MSNRQETANDGMKLKNFQHFVGQHCETTATGTLLKRIGIDLSEPMLFGLGEGLGFLFWNMKTMDFPFIGGRVKVDLLTENLCRNLNLSLNVQKTTSKRKAWQNVVTALDRDMVVGLKLDCFHLDYFSVKFHFAGHYVAMYGYDDDFAYLVDTDQQGGKVKTSIESLSLARSEKGPMSSPNLSYTIDQPSAPPSLEEVVAGAIHRNAIDYLNPPISNLGYQGILKTSREIKKWFASSGNVKHEFQTTAMLMERAGTGGSLFRNLYRDFLKESAQLLKLPAPESACQDFIAIADMWKKVSEQFLAIGETERVDLVDQTSKLLIAISDREREAMTHLADATRE